MLSFRLLFVHTGTLPTQGGAFRLPGEGRHAQTCASTTPVMFSSQIIAFYSLPVNRLLGQPVNLRGFATQFLTRIPPSFFAIQPASRHDTIPPLSMLLQSVLPGLGRPPLSLPVASPPRCAREGPGDARPGPSFTSSLSSFRPNYIIIPSHSQRFLDKCTLVVSSKGGG